MKSTIKHRLAAIALCLGTGLHMTANAGENSHKQYSPEQRIERMSKKLELNDTQQQQLRQVLESKRTEREALHKQAQALRAKTDTEIRALLTPQQREKYDEMKNKRKLRREDSASKHGERDRH